jgi:hypothetical protein
MKLGSEVDLAKLTKAVITWTGYQTASSPTRDKASLESVFSAEEIAKLLPIVLALEEDFYASTANLVARDTTEMQAIASREFMLLHPDLPVEIAKAFGWCYTFDNK